MWNNFVVNCIVGTKYAGFNRIRFLLECLEDLDAHFKKFGGRLYVFHGKPADVLTNLIKVQLLL